MVTHLLGPWFPFEIAILNRLQREIEDQVVSARSLLPSSIPMIPLRPYSEQEQRAVIVDFTWPLVPSFVSGRLAVSTSLLTFDDGRTDEGEEEATDDPLARIDEVCEHFADSAWMNRVLRLMRYRQPHASPTLCGPLRRLPPHHDTATFLATRFPRVCCVGEYAASAAREVLALQIPVLFLSYPLFAWEPIVTRPITALELSRKCAVLAKRRDSLLRNQVWWDLRTILTEETYTN